MNKIKVPPFALYTTLVALLSAGLLVMPGQWMNNGPTDHLLHTLLVGLAIAFCFMMVSVGRNGRAALVMAAACLAVGLLHLASLVSYEPLSFEENIFGVFARLLVAVSLGIMLLFRRTALERIKVLFTISSFIVGGMYVIGFYGGVVVPDVLIESMAYSTLLILVVVLILSRNEANTYWTAALLLLIVGEACLTVLTNLADSFHYVGYLNQALAYACLYRAIRQTGQVSETERAVDQPVQYFESARGRRAEDIPISQIILSHQAVHRQFKFLSTVTRDLKHWNRSEKRLQLAVKIIESINEGVLVTDLDFRIVLTNPAFSYLSGYDEQEARGKHLFFLYPESSRPDFMQQVSNSLKEFGYWQGEIWYKHRNGSTCAVDIQVHSIYDEAGQLDSYASIMDDITERKLREEEMRYRAYYDSLTALPNREFFYQSLLQAIEEAAYKRTKLAVLLLDFNGFKRVNDSCGHLVGDQLLKQFAERVRASLPDSMEKIARLGGDEFVLFTEVEHLKDAEYVAQKLLEATAKPFQIGDLNIEISSSIGISMYPDDGQDMDSLIKYADEAMYRMKEQGKSNRHKFV